MSDCQIDPVTKRCRTCGVVHLRERAAEMFGPDPNPEETLLRAYTETLEDIAGQECEAAGACDAEDDDGAPCNPCKARRVLADWRIE